MHHQTEDQSKTGCSCRGGADHETALLASLLGPIAVVSPRASLGMPVRSLASVLAVRAALAHAPAVPEPRPPRP
ncbi:MAG: hypothetical protein ACRD1V_16615 [Vicinamibacterales bacterium]